MLVYLKLYATNFLTIKCGRKNVFANLFGDVLEVEHFNIEVNVPGKVPGVSDLHDVV